MAAITIEKKNHKTCSCKKVLHRVVDMVEFQGDKYVCMRKNGLKGLQRKPLHEFVIDM
jgi:hypothetical protein